MFVKQLSVFVENKEGSLEQVTETLKKQNINIESLSLADTADYGMLRLIVSNPEQAAKALKENGFSAMLTDVLAVKLANNVGTLQNLLSIVYKAHINIEYMYALSTGKDKASLIIKPSNPDKTLKALAEKGLGVYTPEEAYSIND